MAGTIRRDDILSRTRHRVMDVGLNCLALVLAYGLKEWGKIGIPTETFGWNEAAVTLTGVSLIWLVATAFLETYEYKRRLFNEVVNLLAALMVTIAFFMTFAYFTRVFVYPRVFTVFYAAFGAVLLAGSQAAAQEK